MKLQVTECKKSFKFTNMWVVTYEQTTEDFFTGEKTTVKHSMFSLVKVEPGERTVVKEHKTVTRDGKEVELFWIKEVTE